MTEGAIVMGSRFVLCLRNAGRPEMKAKARFVAQENENKDKQIFAQDIAVLRSSFICLILSTAAQHEFRNVSHNVTQAYLQNEQRL